ncbi:MAG: PP0621 family protein [Candidatus Berkiella sp.]
MIRFIMILCIIYAVFWCAKKLFRYFLVKWLMSLQQQPSAAHVQDDSQKLVQCEYCQTFVPQEKAFPFAKRFYCSEKHAKL